MSSGPLIVDRDDLRTKLRDLLVSEVRQGIVDGDRAKTIAQDIIDELELADDDEQPLVIFERLYARYPQELQALKNRVDASAETDHDQEMARRMAELIVNGRFDDAIALSRGQALAQEIARVATPDVAPEPVPPQPPNDSPVVAEPPSSIATPVEAPTPPAQAAVPVISVARFAASTGVQAAQQQPTTGIRGVFSKIAGSAASGLGKLATRLAQKG